MPLQCFEIEQIAPYDYLLGTKQAVPAKQREVGALFGTILKQKKSLPNKALTLRCFPATICFVPINLLFGQVILFSLITLSHKNLKK